LARKAESARQARLRHKQFVQELQDQVAVLTSRLQHSEVQPTAYHAMRELKGALTPEQLGALVGWCALAPCAQRRPWLPAARAVPPYLRRGR